MVFIGIIILLLLLSLQPHGPRHTSLPRPSLSPTPWSATHQALLCITVSRGCSNSCPLSQWCYLIISSSAASSSSWPQSFPASGSFPMSQLFTLDGQSIRASASALVLPISIQGWLPLGLTGLISLQSLVWSPCSPSESQESFQYHNLKASILWPQPSLWSNSHIHTWLLEKS